MAINSNEPRATTTSSELEIEEKDILTYEVFTSNQQDHCCATIHLSTQTCMIPNGFFIDSIDVAENAVLTIEDCLEAITRISCIKHGKIPVLIMPAEFFTRREEHTCLMTDIAFENVTHAVTHEETIMVPLYRYRDTTYPDVQPHVVNPVQPPVLRFRSNINALLNELKYMGFYLESINPGNRYVFRAFTATAAGYVPCTVVEFEEVFDQSTSIPQPPFQPTQPKPPFQPTQPSWIAPKPSDWIPRNN